MSNSEQSDRRLKVTLVLRDEKDDPSILDIVRVAIEDGLRPAVGTAAVTPTEPKEPSTSPERHSPLGENLETAACKSVEEALENVIKRFQTAGKEPAFDPAKWAEQLSKVWAVIRKAKAAGVPLSIGPNEALPLPPEE